MIKRTEAIEKLEGWARWEMGGIRENAIGRGCSTTTSYMPGDQADHLTVEMALQAFLGSNSPTKGLRSLLLHVYGHELFADSFDPLRTLANPEQRSEVKSFLTAFGWRADAFSQACAKRFVRFLGRRLLE